MQLLGMTLHDDEVAAGISFAAGWLVVGLKSLFDRLYRRFVRAKHAQPQEQAAPAAPANVPAPPSAAREAANVMKDQRSRALRQLCRLAQAAEEDAAGGATERCEVFVNALRRNILWLPSDVGAEATGVVDAWDEYAKSGGPTAPKFNEFLKRTRDLRRELESEFRMSIGLA